ncbi:MAG TPA: carboxyl transferase domain-containing protein, partial [Trebonia sp.]|nr:carboxyl transferase domain-containing protein [Trebonia sp.]
MTAGGAAATGAARPDTAPLGAGPRDSAPRGGADTVRAALRAAARGLDTGRWPDKLPVADRLAVLLDPGSWVEDGLLANAEAGNLPADGVRTGTGRIEGRPVAVIAHDFAVKAGSWGRLTCEKQIRMLERADRDLLPVIYLVDSAGGRLTDQLGFFSDRRGASRIFQLQVALSGRVPQLCCLLGPSAAGGAYMPAFTDWVGMVDGNASMYLASPRVAEKVTGERTTLEEMGGAMMHATVSGCGDEVFGSDWEAIAAARLLLSYLPRHWRERPAARPPAAPERPGWDGVIPESESVGYDIHAVIDRLVDGGSFFEIKARWAAELVTGLARLGGQVVGIVANQPQVRSGAIFVDSADKAARFITMCDAFNIPLVFLHDVPGFMVGAAVERQGIIRHGAKMITAMASAEVPKFSVILRKSYAAGYYAMCAPGFEPRASIALPGATIGPMAAEASVNAMYAKKIEEIGDPGARASFIEERIAEQRADLDLLRLAADPERRGWDGVIPESESAGYDIHAVIDRLVDAGSFFEIKARWAEELVTGLARLG